MSVWKACYKWKWLELFLSAWSRASHVCSLVPKGRILFSICSVFLGQDPWLKQTKKKFSSSNQGTLLCQAEGACGKQKVGKKIKSCWQECPWNCSGTHHTALVLGSKVMVRQILKVTCYLWVGMEIRYQKTGSGPFFLSERVSAIDAVVDLGKFVH